jgi:hypothetical protein
MKILWAWVAAMALLSAGGRSEAVERCTAKVNAKTGAIEVSGAGVEGSPLWSTTAGSSDARAFFDAATCVSGAKLKRCHLGSPGTESARTAPAGCLVHVTDDGPTPCIARISACTPGLRANEAATVESDGDFPDVSLYVTNPGTGGAVLAETLAAEEGTAIAGYNYGSGHAGDIQNLDTANSSAALFVRTRGTAPALQTEVNEPTSSADALFARTTSPIAGSYAGVFSGPVQISCSAVTCNTTNALQVVGNFAATVKNFKIDHPLDPANKYLLHTSVESPDMKNLYDGSVTTDSNGLATIALPDYFEALNRDFRYQLTVIGTFAQAIVKDEIAENRFTIETDRPGVKVSWQVTGIRHDTFAERHRVKVEEDKRADERGTFLEPPVAPGG